MFRSTTAHKNYWSRRKIDWKKEYYDTWNHPHRKMIIDELNKLSFGSLLEVGCASGPNLALISKLFPQVTIGGIDVSGDAIEIAKKLLPEKTLLYVDSCENVFFSDNSTDVLLSDACLIYVGPRRIRKVMSEIKRVTRKNLIFVEFHSSKWWERLGISYASGYYAHDYSRLLPQYGFHSIEIKKIPEEIWGYPWSKFGYVITAKV